MKRQGNGKSIRRMQWDAGYRRQPGPRYRPLARSGFRAIVRIVWDDAPPDVGAFAVGDKVRLLKVGK